MKKPHVIVTTMTTYEKPEKIMKSDENTLSVIIDKERLLEILENVEDTQYNTKAYNIHQNTMKLHETPLPEYEDTQNFMKDYEVHSHSMKVTITLCSVLKEHENV